MRAKVAIPLLLLGIFAVLLPFIFRHKNPMTDGQTTQAAAIANPSAPETIYTRRAAMPSRHLLASAGNNLLESNGITGDAAKEADENYVDDRMTELANLGMTDDPGSLVTIESEFES